MAHDANAMQVIRDAIAAEIVRPGFVKALRALPVSDEEVALSILDALEQNGLAVVRVPSDA